MNDLNELFWDASVDEMKKGYVFDPPSESYVCLICGAKFVEGQVFPDENAWFVAEKAAKNHLYKTHGAVFHYLIEMNKKYTGLTDHQKNLLYYFFEGLSDKEIAAKLENGNTSTIRAQRFSFREKAKQAKVFLAIMELLEDQSGQAPRSIPAEQLVEVPRTATMVDERFAITQAEYREIVRKYFPHGPKGPIALFPKKEKRKLVILHELIKRFSPEQKYSEKEINEILKQAHDDYVTLRRYLIEYGFLDRRPDGGEYWVKT